MRVASNSNTSFFFKNDKKAVGEWGHTDSNREPSSYEPPALTVELCPLKKTNGYFESKIPLA